MPITLPVLDDRNYEQILEETLRRIPGHTPEWTNFGQESDPGVTIVQLFAFLAEGLIYRANRIPEVNRLKFLQLLNVPLQPASSATGLVAIKNERGPVAPLLLEQGVVVTAGNVQFITRDPVNVLPIQTQIMYKQALPDNHPSVLAFRDQYEAVLAARLAQQADLAGEPLPAGGEFEDLGITPQFYEPALMPLPRHGEPLPAFDLETGVDNAIYLALLAQDEESVESARREIANEVLTIGIAPAASGTIPPLEPLETVSGQPQGSGLTFEIADTSASTDGPIARYVPMKVIQQTNVLNKPGLVMVQLPDFNQIGTWTFDEPLQEGTGEFPPRIEDDEINKRLITWLRIRLPDPLQDQGSTNIDHQLSWVGINAARVVQSVPVFNEDLGSGTGEPDQLFALTNVPVLPASVHLAVEEGSSLGWQTWRLVDDLLAAGPDDRVFSLNPESGVIRFGALRGKRPRGRILVSYEYGGGPQGNVSIGALNASPDSRLQGGYKIGNPIPTNGGALGETVADGERRIPQTIRHCGRLVTIQDFRDITRRTPGVNVGRVEVLPLFSPNQPEERFPGMVTLMVIPRFDSLDPLWPRPDRLFLRRVCDHLDTRRLITTEIYVRGPDYLPVYVSVGIQVRAGYFVEEIVQDVEMRLRQYLSSLPPGGPDGEGWPLKKSLVSKDLDAVATRVPGVEFVQGLEMGVITTENIPDYPISGMELPRLVGVRVRQGPVQSLQSVFAPPGSGPSLTEGVPIAVSRAKC